MKLSVSARDYSGWCSGTFGDLTFDAKVFDNPSVFGINDGHVSKLHVVRAGETYYTYDRGGKTPPDDVLALVQALESHVGARAAQGQGS